MSTYFETLNETEITALKDAFVYITVMVAGADGHIGINEIEEAEHTIKVRGYEANNLFHLFYDEIYKDFKVKVESTRDLNGIGEESNIIYAEKLSAVNPILAKLPHNIARHLYKDLLSFSHRIANAEGGVLGFRKVGSEEQKVYNLPMIEKISPTDEEKEEVL